MKIYAEVLIESVEQAEALPEGSVAMHEDHWPVQKFQGKWQSENLVLSSADLIGWTTYELIEVEEEARDHPGVMLPTCPPRHPQQTRFVTRWEDA